MKNNLLVLLLVFFFYPAIGFAAGTTTIEVEFAPCSPENPEQPITGYRLYKEGQLVCETTNTEVTRIICDITSEEGTFDFTLTAFAPGYESPHSDVFLFTIDFSTAEPPTAVLTSSTGAGYAPMAVTFDGDASTTPNTPIVSYHWNFGDGSQATGNSVTHTFTNAGTYHTTLTVEDSKGLTDSVATPIVVLTSSDTNQSPTAAITASQPGTDSSFTAAFDGSQSTDPDGSIAMYSWDFGDGTTGAGEMISHVYTNIGTYTVTLTVTDDKGATATARTDFTCTSTPLTDEINIEVGEVSIDHTWVKVLFENSFIQPVVVSGPPTANGAHPVLVRIRNIDQQGFEIRLQEWDYLDGSHCQETISYIVMEKGTFTLDNGLKIEAGSFTGTNVLQTIGLLQAYESMPIILTQVISDNEANAVTGRISETGQESFDYILQEEEKTKTAHSPETVGYIAWEPGTGTLPGMVFEAVRTADNATHNWSTVNFKTTFPELPLFIAGMQTNDGPDTAAMRSQNISLNTAQVKIEEEQSLDSETAHTTEVVGYLAFSANTDPELNTDENEENNDDNLVTDFNIEAGEVSIDHTWVKVPFENSFAQPVVVAGPPSANGVHPVLVRIRNIDQDGFEIRLQEWGYLDGSHVQETISYIVMEKGTFTLDNGVKIEAGSFSGTNVLQTIGLLQAYESTPIILTQVISDNDSDAVTGRISETGRESFGYILQEEEKTKTAHSPETVGYIAWEPGTGTLPGLVFEAVRTADNATHDWSTVNFNTTFPELPLFIAGMQTTDGPDTAVMRSKDISLNTAQVKIEEEQSKDSETAHTTEVVGYLAISATP